jgi:glycerol-3-phosphate dehydrogenase (NAD(P)+)
LKATIGVLGGGSWGSAIALMLARKNQPVLLWLRDAERAEEMARKRMLLRYLPGRSLPESIQVTSRLEEALEASTLLLTVPLQAYRSTLMTLATSLKQHHELVLLSKGMEVGTLLLPTEIVCSCLGEAWRLRCFTLSGPSFAEEVADGKPTTVVLAGLNHQRLKELQKLLMSDSFRIYGNDDVLGVELAGALKNVMAIAAGIVWGRELGYNALAALITRGLAEIARMGACLGARPETFAGLAGMGDLILTCTGGLSRNLRVGLGLAKNQSLPEIMASLGMVAEGVHTCKSAVAMAEARGVDMPIVQTVGDILYAGLSPQEGLHRLMTRSPKWESTQPPSTTPSP